MMDKLHIEEAFGIERGTWLLCIHCEQAYQAGEYIEHNGLQMCPYVDCDGSTVLGGWLWSDIKKKHLDYSEIPERNKVYPMN